MRRPSILTRLACSCLLASLVSSSSPAPSDESPRGVLDRMALLERQDFWDNRDFEWYLASIPFIDTPDAEIDTTWYYRWELVTKHFVYGSPEHGYSLTEFIDRPAWSGTYGAIVCPAGHQLYETRWLRDPRYARDFARYWFRTPGARPYAYSSWLLDGIRALDRVHPDPALVRSLLPDMTAYWRRWKRERFVEEVGLVWQTGMADGMETNINSRQTQDWFAGAPGFRPTLNSYLWADALALAAFARAEGDDALAHEMEREAESLRDALQSRLWDPKREFFFHMFQRDEEKDGHVVRALTLTHETGRFAGDPHGRELIGYVPWQFGLPEPGFEAAWRFLTDRERFWADFGPTVTERNDPLFLISPGCCVWSGQSWPYATSQTIRALENVVRDYEQDFVDRDDWFRLLGVYTRTHRKDGRPYIAEAAHPDTGSWSGHDHQGHSEHYFHSSYCDLIVTGLFGVLPGDGRRVVIDPLAPRDWAWFALDALPCKGRLLGVVWDRDGSRYGRGAGLLVLVDGEIVARSPRLERLEIEIDPVPHRPRRPLPINVAVNNSGLYYPKARATSSAPGSSPALVHDGQYWYHVSPPNRWVSTGGRREDSVEIDFGVERIVDTVKLYFLDDGEGEVRAPDSYVLELRVDGEWKAPKDAASSPARPEGRRATIRSFDATRASALRVTLRHRAGSRSGLSEVEAWGPGDQSLAPAAPPAGNLAVNPRGEGFPRATASFTSRFDRIEWVHDGLVSYRPSPHNRWTAYESPETSDWVEIDFGAVRSPKRAVLHFYDDRGGVQPPKSFSIELWSDDGWRAVRETSRQPKQPTGGTETVVTFEPARTSKLRVVLEHRGAARSGLTEFEIWED